MADDVVREFRSGLTSLVRELDSTGLEPATFIDFVAGLKALISQVGLRAFVETVARHEEAADVVEHAGEFHRFKMDSTKEWITPFGLAVVPRRYFQPDRGGEGVVPLDLAAAGPTIREWASLPWGRYLDSLRLSIRTARSGQPCSAMTCRSWCACFSCTAAIRAW